MSRHLRVVRKKVEPITARRVKRAMFRQILNPYGSIITHIVKLVDVIFSVLTEGGIGRAGQLVTPIVDFSTTTSVKKIPATSFYKLRENSIAFFVVDPLTQISQNVFESEDFSPS